MKSSLSSIRKYCPVEYKIKLLTLGPSDEGIMELVKTDYESIELINVPPGTTVGGGRRILARQVETDLTMMMDDDLCLTDNSIPSALQVLDRYGNVGAVSMPHYNGQGQMISAGGRKLVIRNGIVYRLKPRIDYTAQWIEVEDLDGSAMIYRTQMRNCFDWDEHYTCAFDDIDKSLSIFTNCTWKQAIVPKGRVIHDRSWMGKVPHYQAHRYNGIAMRSSYRLFRAKWGLRLDLRTHILIELFYPTIAVMRLQWPVIVLDAVVRRRAISALNVSR